MPTKSQRVLTAKLLVVVRKVLRAHLSSVVISLLIQYSLLISLVALPFLNVATVHADERLSFAGGPTTRDFLKSAVSKSASKAGGSQQDPQRPTITPPVPGIGRGGNGPDGSFNVDPPSRLQGPPDAVRDTTEVLNEAREPRIPDPIPSTEGYCWPGDPACRKSPRAAMPRTPAPRPTPPPRPKRASGLQPELMVASNGGYIEKLLSDAMPYLSHLWNSDDLLRPENRSNSNPSHSAPYPSGFVPPKNRAESVSASYIWADCTNVQGFANGAQASVYIYIDGFNVGQAPVEGGDYFSFDISAYVTDGAYHDISAWYYSWDWLWLEAGSTAVSGCYPFYDFDTPRLDPPNDTGDPGVNPGSQNINWSLPLVSLPGRGLDLDLALTYNSLVWIKSADGAAMMFDPDHGFPSPGFRLRFPIIQGPFFNSNINAWSYMLVSSSGARTELRHVGNTTYEAADSTYTRMVDHLNGLATVWLRDGTQMSFDAWNGEYRCNKIKDRNGNFINLTYTTAGFINTITDTLGRQIVFNYDTYYRLTSISQVRAGLVDELVTFGYESVSFSPSFPGFSLFAPTTSTIPVLTQVGFADGTRYNFEYTTFGQVNKIRRHEADNRLLTYVRYNLGTGAQSDCPRFSEERVWAENWNNNQEALTTYSGSSSSGLSQVTTPDTVVHKQFYHTTGWRKGLVEKTESWWSGVKRKWTEMYWTQDNESLSYQVNPRVNDLRVFDEAGNQRRTTIEYTSYGLPSNVREYSGATVVRRQETQYRFDAGFVDRRILGVLWMQLIYQGESTLMSKLNYHHDWTDPDAWNGQTPSTGHDTANYGSNFTWGRANVTGILRYNLSAPSDANQAVWVQRFGYNAAGSIFRMKDGANHPVTIGYNDSFSDNVNRGTLAYPTSVTDPDNYTATSKYYYETGAITRTEDPKGGVETRQYDTIGRIERLENQFTGGYRRWYYTVVGEIVGVTRIDSSMPETMSVQYRDGAGRMRGVISHLPNTTGQWRAQTWAYDIMGRLKEQTNPTEVTQAWIPTGDDSAGWVVTQQTYDWQGRPRITYNPDGSTREMSYTGCGCAGGDVVTVRDERGRRRKLFNDTLGRLVKVEELNWDQSVYSTTIYSYNARDQLTQSSQAGQLRTNSYDNHGRLLTRTTPEQGAATYSYNVDDTVQSITDARNAVATFSYNARKLVTGISFTVPSGVAATPNVTFQYDSAGNRTSMSSSESTVTYGYDTASRLTSESRTFNGVSGSFALNYQYNQAGQLTEITNPWNVKVGYSYNYAGEMTGVTGQNYGGVSTYASGMVYRAFGGLKQVNYANGRTLSMGYNNRMFLTQWSIPSVMRWNYAYNYFSENTGRVVYAQNVDDGTLDRAYDYDHAGRPTHFTSGSNARHFTGQGGPVLNDGPYSQGYNFDVWGNRTWIEGWGGVGRNESALYTNNRRNAFGYDAAGNVTYDLQQTMTYDATGQQATASYGGNLLTQTYDGDRLRVKKVENSTPTYYLRSTVLGGQIVAELNSSGAMTRGFVYQGGKVLAVQQNSQVSWVHEDPFVKSKRVTNSSGAVVSTIELDPWGGDTARSNNQAFQPRRFTSYTRDGNDSDEAMHRRYNRWHMRFDQPDPYGGSYDMTNPQSFNRYSYVQNDPVNFVDPLGLDGLGALGGAAAGAINQPIGPGTVSVTINISDDDDFVIETGPVETGGWGDLGGGGGGGGTGGPNWEPQEPAKPSHDAHPRNDCTNMADRAQEIANQAIASASDYTGKTASAILKNFNRIFATEFAGTHAAEGALGMIDMPMWGSSEQNRARHGQRGFPNEYRDEKHTADDDDQTHHFAAYFSAGLAGHKIAPNLHRLVDGVGDANLGRQAQRLGQYLRKNPGELKNVGQLIRDTICNAQPVPK